MNPQKSMDLESLLKTSFETPIDTQSDKAATLPLIFRFPERVDATALRSLKSCEMKWGYETLARIIASGEHVHLNFGAAFATGCHVFRQSWYFDFPGDWDKALALASREALKVYGNTDPRGTAKSSERLLISLERYFKHWHPETDRFQPLTSSNSGRPMTEFSFAVPLPGTSHPDTHQPILYQGRADTIGELDGKSKWISDEKTTSGIGPTWSRQWSLRSQFKGYVWAARQYGIEIEGTLVRGIAVLMRDIKFAEAFVPISSWDIDRWLKSTVALVNRHSLIWREATAKKIPIRDLLIANLDDSCTAYGGCPFRRLCLSPNPDHWIEGEYEKNLWDPLTQE